MITTPAVRIASGIARHNQYHHDSTPPARRHSQKTYHRRLQRQWNSSTQSYHQYSHPTSPPTDKKAKPVIPEDHCQHSLHSHPPSPDCVSHYDYASKAKQTNNTQYHFCSINKLAIILPLPSKLVLNCIATCYLPIGAQPVLPGVHPAMLAMASR